MEDVRRTRNQLCFLIGTVLSMGTLGYYLLEEGWSLMDAFYMTVITITTIGYGEVHELSHQGRVFTVLLIVFGLGVSALFATHFARLLVENALKGAWGKRKMDKKIAGLKGHFIVCGFGQIGRTICAELQEKSIPFAVIDSAEEPVQLAAQRDYPVLRGNATTDLILLSAGIQQATGLVAGLPSDADNLYLSLTARELNPKLNIVVRSEGEGVERRMHRAGADIVVSPIKLGGRQIAHMLASQAGEGEGEEGTLSSVLGYHLKVYRNVTGQPMPVAEAVEETGALRALARKGSDGSLLDNPGPGDALGPEESLVLLFSEGQRRDGEAPAAEITWDSGLSVGVMSLDEEHQTIIGLIQKLKLASQHNEREVIKGVVNELTDYTVKHFRREEALLEEQRYPELEKHRGEHREFTERVLSMRKEKHHLVKENFSYLLNAWLRHHIMVTDKRYSDFLNSRGIR